MILINRQLLTAVFLAALLAGCESIGVKKTDQTATSAPHPAATPAAALVLTLTPQPEERKYDNVWDRIRAGYGLPQVSNSTIDAHIRFYTSKKHYFYGVMQKSEPYLYFVANEMQANGMPMELALLPFIESSYNPAASSPGNQHVGMWQFGAATGRTFGLKQNNGYDGRKDVVASTDAAIRLLKKLYTRFDNDWLLAVAAYNAGDGSIQQAINKNRKAGKPTDFWSLPLNKTTQGYIPQLLALSKIVADPNIYDFKLYPIQNEPYFVKINVGSQINITEAARQSSLDVTLLKKLNAGFKTDITDPTEPRYLLVPVDSAASFRLQLDSLPKITNTKAIPPPENPQQNAKNVYYTVKSGENLWSIAKAQNTSVAALARLNNMNNISVLKRGQKLIVQSQTGANQANNSPAHDSQARPSETKEAQAMKHTIKTGDTLGKIAAQYDVSVKQLMEWNKIKDETSIRPKQELIVLVDAKN